MIDVFKLMLLTTGESNHYMSFNKIKQNNNFQNVYT